MNELMQDVAVLKATAASFASDDPWARAQRLAASSERRDVRGGMAPPADEPRPGETSRGRTFPLAMAGPLLAIAYKDRNIFDDKIMLHSDFRYDGNKGGAAWKSRVERYFISKAPALRELLEWAESMDQEVITEALMVQAVSRRLDDEQALKVNAQLWGFLSGCFAGTAETMFKRAEVLNGVDAWRRIVRHVDHGKAIYLETLRREKNEIHQMLIKCLEAVEDGVANFENVMQE